MALVTETILDRIFHPSSGKRTIPDDSVRPLTSYARLVLYILHYRKAAGFPDGIPTKNYYNEFGISYHLVKQAIESLTEHKIITTYHAHGTSEVLVKCFRIKGNSKSNQLIKPPDPLHDFIKSGRLSVPSKKPEKLSVPERMVVAFLVYKSDTSGVTQGFFNSDICNSTGVSRDQLLRILKKLKAKEVISKTIPGYNGSRSLKRLPTVYFINRACRFVNSNHSSQWKSEQRLNVNIPFSLAPAAESARISSHKEWTTWFNKVVHKLDSVDMLRYVTSDNNSKRSLALILLDERRTLGDIDRQHISWAVMEAAEIILIHEFRYSPGLINQLIENRKSWSQIEKKSLRKKLNDRLMGIFLDEESHYQKLSKIFLRIAKRVKIQQKALESESTEVAQSAIAGDQYESEARELLRSARDYLAEWLVKSAVEVAFNTQRFITDQDLFNTEKKSPQFGCRLLLTDSTNAEQSDVTLLLGEVDHSAPAKLAVHPLPPSHREPL